MFIGLYFVWRIKRKRALQQIAKVVDVTWRQKWESGQGGKKHHPSLSAAAAPACIAKLSLPTNQPYPTLPYLTLTHPTLALPNVKNLYITEQNHPSLSAAAAACITKLSILPTNQPYPNFKGNTLPCPTLPLPNVKNL